VFYYEILRHILGKIPRRVNFRGVNLGKIHMSFFIPRNFSSEVPIVQTELFAWWVTLNDLKMTEHLLRENFINIGGMFFKLNIKTVT
jgi:hypothetical protein